MEESGRKEEISYLNFTHDLTLLLRITSLRMTLRCPPRDSASSKFMKKIVSIDTGKCFFINYKAQI